MTGAILILLLMSVQHHSGNLQVQLREIQANPPSAQAYFLYLRGVMINTLLKITIKAYFTIDLY